MKKLLALFILTCLFFMAPLKVCSASAASDSLPMLDEHGAVMMLIDPETSEILYANHAAAAFYGYTKEQLQAMKITQINTLSPEETIEEMQAAKAEIQNTFTFLHLLANGEVRTVEVFSYPVLYGEKTVLFSVIHDVTEKTLLQEHHRQQTAAVFLVGAAVIAGLLALSAALYFNHRKIKQSHQEIENLNTLIRTFINSSNSMIYLKDENLKYIFVNHAFEKYTHKSEREMVGFGDLELFDTTAVQKRWETDKNALEKGELTTDEVSWEGHIYSTIKFPVKMLDGNFGVGALIRDITKDREQEKRKEKMLERTKILADTQSFGFKSTQEQLDFVLHRALELTESRYGYIYLYDEEKKEFTLNSWTSGVMEECSVADPQTKYQLEKTGVWGEVVRQRKPIILNNFEQPNFLKKGYPEGHVALTRFMTVPVMIDDAIVAVVGLSNKLSDYDENDVYDLTILMGGVWHAVQKRIMQDQLAYERNKYLQTLISIGDGVMVVDKNGSIEILNHVAQKLTGWTNEEACGKYYKEVFQLLNENQNELIKDPVDDAFKTDTVQELGNHAMLLSRNGEKYYLEDSAAPVKNEAGENVGVVLVFRDVTEKKEQSKKIEYLSFHDELTGLYNRRFFEEEILRIDTARNLPISIVMGDVNGLKLTNDVFGHACGDALLKGIADVFRSVCRADDIVARWGGDEFVLLLPKTGKKEAQNIVSRIKTEFSKQHIKAIRGSISMGIDVKDTSGEKLPLVLTAAEEKMYVAKATELVTVKTDEINLIIQTLHENSQREKGHSLRVSKLCEALGKALNLPEVDVHKLNEAGYFHDIGKIALDPKILNKHYQLNEEEWNEFKKHPIVGYRILNSFDNTLNLAEPVLAHQENWDGTGYPKGLKGEEIPLLARIIAVAEAYDRIVHDSENYKARSKEEAIEKLKSHAGTQFDPKITQVFIEMLKSGTLDEMND